MNLYSSKNLDLIWLPENWSDQILHGSPAVWFWRVSAVFAAWATRVVSRAKKANAQLPSHTVENLGIIRAYIQELAPEIERGSALTTVDDLAAQPGKITLPDFSPDILSLAQLGVMPKWKDMPS